MADMLASLVPLLGQALLHFIWQGALIGLLCRARAGRIAQCTPAGAVRRCLPCPAALRADADRDDAVGARA